MTTDAAPLAPLHKIPLTNGAAVELATLASPQVRGLLTKPALIRRVSQFVKEHMRDLPRECKDPNDMADWADEPFIAPEVRERTRDALKALVKAAADKGVLPCTAGVGHLLEVLGLADEEG